ncbi:MAG TPA: glycosyl transferase family 1 [Chitinophagaceae bacterium]|nr:glycosyl transferase family 1 [Chitinophagaceae bacterium]
MVVVYYTSPSFMDTVPEIIRGFKHAVELHVVIEISTQNMNSTNINVNSLDGLGVVEDPEKVLGKEQWALFEPYFEGVASVKFVVHNKKQSLSWHSLKRAWQLGRYLKKLKADIFHFDTISPRALGLYPYLLGRKVIITLHDPVPHAGEDNWREDVPIIAFFRLAKAFVFYSEFAANEFKKHYNKIKVPVHTIRMQPLSFTKYFIKGARPEPETILFFGRVSYYKGIDILMQAIPKVLAQFPDERFVIAGKPVFGYEIDMTPVKGFEKNVQVISRFLTTDEMVQLIRDAKFVVCPYREATQSGVIMTSYAVGKPVVGTTVGSFAEYIQDGVNGILSAPGPDALADAMIKALSNKRYLELEKNVDGNYNEDIGSQNGKVLLKAYSQALHNKKY